MAAALKKTDRDAAKDWDAYIANFLSATTVDALETEAQRRTRVSGLEGDFETWKQYYFPKYCYAPAAAFHKRASRRILEHPEWYECRVWARELAKDALCMMETIFQVLTGRKRNIMLISNSYDKAVKLLTPYRLNLERNQRIINDYGKQASYSGWTDGAFTTTGGAAFTAVGADQSPRGSRSEEVRPDKVIISDIDTDQDVRNTEIINKRWEWFERAVYPTRSVSQPFQVIWLGNLIARDCCVARAMKKANKVDVVNLEDKDGQSTWPEKNTPEQIAQIRASISTAAYEAEYKNNPVHEGTTFKELKWGKCPPLGRFSFLVDYADPSPSNNTKSKANSYKANFLVGICEGKVYVITGYLDRTTNAEFVNWFYYIDKFVGGKAPVYYYVENNKLQDPMYEQVIRPLIQQQAVATGKVVPVTGDTRTKPDKFARIEAHLEPLNREGLLILNEAEKDNPHLKRLEEQFLLVEPKLSAPADGPDCVEGGYWIANTKMQEQAVASIHFPKRSRNRFKI
jgi:hypothetical protein